MDRYRAGWGLAVMVVWCVLTLAAAAGSARAAIDKEKTYGSLQDRLIADGFDEKFIRELYARPEVQFETKGISAYFVYRESKVNYDRYTDTYHIGKAREYLNRHKSAFDETEKIYGVDREVITAIILVETQLGTMLGRRLVLNTLSTMAAISDPKVRNLLWSEVKETPGLTRKDFDKKAAKKSDWSYRELKAYLRHTTKEGFDPVELNGSFAGAMGISQFMPSNIDQLAKDGNNDGRINLFDDEDAIASIAFYLKQHGWYPGIDRAKAAKVVYHYNHSDLYVEAILNVTQILKS
jgi:membrane-bound lytic murein transglycosylase B